MKKITFSIYFMLISAFSIFAQSTEPFLVEAESGTLGSDYTTGTDGSITYVYPQTNFLATTNPGSATKVITYNITFPEADTYDLYMKIYIGPLGDNDDSFYVANSMGAKDPFSGSDWVNMNQLNNTGFTTATDVVTGELVTPEIINQWKWVNISQLHNTSGWSYDITPDNLTVTYQIGAREDGIWFDKLVFGKTGTSYTVSELEAAATLSTAKFDILNTVSVYPNPTNNQFTIDSKEKYTSYKIYNILGAKVKEGTFYFGKNTYGKDLKAGSYILDMTSSNKRKVMKLIKF